MDCLTYSLLKKKSSAGKIGSNKIFTTSDFLSPVSSFALRVFSSPLSTVSIFPVSFSFYTHFQGKHMGKLFIFPFPLKILNIFFLVCSLPLTDVLCSLLLWFCLSALHINNKNESQAGQGLARLCRMNKWLYQELRHWLTLHNSHTASLYLLLQEETRPLETTKY